MRKFVLIVILSVSSLAFAQDEYHDDEFGFTIKAPSGWNITFKDQLSAKGKESLKKAFSNEVLLMIHPPDTEPPKNPCILFNCRKLVRTTTSEAIADLKKLGNEALMKSTRFLGWMLLGRKEKQYTEIDEFYDYDSSLYRAVSKVLYQHNQDGSYALCAKAKFIGLQRVTSFSAYWKGDDPEEFWQVFTEVIDSFEFDDDARPKGILGTVPQEIKEVSKLSSQEMFKRVWKWIGIILPVLIVLGFVKMALSRWFS